MNNQYSNQNADNLSYVMKANIYEGLGQKQDFNQDQMKEEGFSCSQGIYGNINNSYNNTVKNEPEGYHYGSIFPNNINNQKNFQNNNNWYLNPNQHINININLQPKNSMHDQTKKNIQRNIVKNENVQVQLNKANHQPNNNGYYIQSQSQKINMNQLGQQYSFLNNNQYQMSNIPNNINQKFRRADNNYNGLNQVNTDNSADKLNDTSKQLKKKLTFSNINDVGETLMLVAEKNNDIFKEGDSEKKIIKNENNKSGNSFGDKNDSLKVNSGSIGSRGYQMVPNNINRDPNVFNQNSFCPSLSHATLIESTNFTSNVENKDLNKDHLLSTIDPNNYNLKQIKNENQIGSSNVSSVNETYPKNYNNNVINSNNYIQNKSEYHYRESQDLMSLLRNNIKESSNDYNQNKGDSNGFYF